MKDTVGAERKFAIYTQFLDTTLWGETEVQEGETRQEARARLLKELEEDADRLKMEFAAKSGNYQVTNAGTPVFNNTPPPVIQQERTDRHAEIITIGLDISKCQTIEELSQYKIIAGTNEQLRTMYMDKLKSLQ